MSGIMKGVADCGIELMEREEAAVAQPGQHEPLNNLHRHLDLGLVARPPRTRGQDRSVVVLGQLLVGTINPRLIAAGHGDAGLPSGPRADACGFGDGLRRLPARDLPYNPLSTARRQPGILMHVHPVLLEFEASATSASSVRTGWTTY